VDTEILRALVAHRPGIRTSWETLLRLERPSSPLANPDALVHLLDKTLDEIFADLVLWSPRAHPRSYVPHCPCGLNPWLAYLSAGRQAFRQALIEAQAAVPALGSGARDESLACLEQVLDHLSRREIEAFCALCQSRAKLTVQPAPASEAHHAHH
jgi:hypothetical protein